MIDALQIFDGTLASNGVPTGAAVTTSRASSNVIDMLANRDLYGGVGPGVDLHVAVTQAFVGGTSLQIAYQTSPDNSAFVDILLSPVILTASLVAGISIFKVRSPAFQLNDTGTPNRYHRLNYTVSGTYTGGALFAYLTAGGDRQQTPTYPAGYSLTT